MNKAKKIQKLTIKRNGILAALAHRVNRFNRLTRISSAEIDTQARMSRKAAELETRIAYLK